MPYVQEVLHGWFNLRFDTRLLAPTRAFKAQKRKKLKSALQESRPALQGRPKPRRERYLKWAERECW
jgi:hypothetical protein